MQSYEEFKANIEDRFTAAFPDAEIRIHPVTKNNHTVLDGLIVLAPGSNISPTIYLDQVYEIYRESGDFERIWQDLYAIYREYGQTQTVDLSFLSDFERVRPHLYCRLISADRNEHLLEEVPHRPFLDLAIVYYIGFAPGSIRSRGSILVTNEQMSYWDVTEDTLYSIALRNNREDDPPQLIPLASFLGQEDGCGPAAADPEDPVPLYILTNRDKCFGACAMLDQEILRDFASQAGDFYILPSSLHEVLLISKSCAPQPQALNQIIRDVNSTHLDPTDILSDHLYTYSVNESCIC